jgi:hypothetical protein
VKDCKDSQGFTTAAPYMNGGTVAQRPRAEAAQ